ncbi:MAG: hypothetical protein ACI4QT_02020 [Kiritimatiellia bacterium]
MHVYLKLLLGGILFFGLEFLFPKGFSGLLALLCFLCAGWAAVQRFDGITGTALAFLAILLGTSLTLLQTRFLSRKNNRPPQ